MAFTELKLSKTLPSSVEGIYFFPYTWFRYGLAEGKLEIDDIRKFSRSLQGSVLSFVDEQAAKLVEQGSVEMWKSYQFSVRDKTKELWLSFQGGSSVVTTYWIDPEFCQRIDAPNTKAGFVTVCGLDKLLNSTFNEQRTINNSIISQFAGCGVKMLDSVWYFSEDRIFSLS